MASGTRNFQISVCMKVLVGPLLWALPVWTLPVWARAGMALCPDHRAIVAFWAVKYSL